MTEFAKVYVKPGAGVRVPLRIPGTPVRVPQDGAMVARDFAVERLLRSKDLVLAEVPEPAKETRAAPAAPAKGG